MHTIKALIFDFDGLILDTETPQYEAWREIFAENGAELSLDEWAVCLGTHSEVFDAVGLLQRLTGHPFERNAINSQFTSRSMTTIINSPPLPGSAALIEHASKSGLLLGLASSSPRSWVTSLLQRLSLFDLFDCIFCAEDVAQVKPSPELYKLTLQQLCVSPEATIAFEDSPNGITAARKAGIFCVGVPNALSRFLDIHHADMIIPSLDALPPDELIKMIQGKMIESKLLPR